MPDFFDLNGRTVLVTGAAGHLGSAISLRLAQAGAFVYLNGRTPSKLEALAKTIRKSGGECGVLAFDVTDRKTAKKSIGTIRRLDGLVNNAFMALAGSIDDSDYEDFQKSFGANVSALFSLSQLCLPLLERKPKQERSSIVNIASMYGMVSPDPGIYGNSGMNNPPFYGASKAAVIQLTRYFACHLADRGIRTNAVSPGPFPPEGTVKKMPAFHKQLCRKNPLGRTGEPGEVASAVHFLLSNDASYVNGANLPVDGGWTAW